MVNAILVTGGAGFIGSCLVRQWLRNAWFPDELLGDSRLRIINLDRLTYAGNLDSLASVKDDPRHVFVHGDICDAHLVSRLLSENQVRAVVNLAAESHVDRSIDGPAPFLQTNVVGTFTLLEASLRYWRELSSDQAAGFRFVHVSTDEVFGSLGPEGKFTEKTPYAPNSPYSASKASADHFVRVYHHTYGLPTITTNCSNNYGPYQFPEKLIPLVILNALEGKPIPVYGDGQNVRDWLFVEDHVHAIAEALANGRVGETYNIGGNSARPNLEVVQLICQVVDELAPALKTGPRANLIRFVEDRPGHDRRYAIDASKIMAEIGWAPSITFESGLRRTVQWYLENTAWTQRVQSGAYQRERLGLGPRSR